MHRVARLPLIRTEPWYQSLQCYVKDSLVLAAEYIPADNVGHCIIGYVVPVDRADLFMCLRAAADEAERLTSLSADSESE